MDSRRVAAVHLWALPVESVLEDQLTVLGGAAPMTRLAAVREEVRGQRVLVSVTDEARRRGIKPGIKESEGKARDFDLEVRPRDVSLEQARLENAAELLYAFGPDVEIAPPCFLFVEIGHSRAAIARRLKNKTRSIDDRTIAEAIQRTLAKAGHVTSVAVAKDPDTARTFAEHLTRLRHAAHDVEPPPREAGLRRRGGRTKPPPRSKKPAKKSKPSAHEEAASIAIVAPNEERAALARLPLEAIAWTDRRDDPDGLLHQRAVAAIGSLRLLGIHDVVRFSSLPAAQVTSRFGDAGALLARRAAAETERPLRRFAPPERMVESFELDAVTEDLEPILFVLKRLFDRLEARLFARSQSIGGLAMSFLVEPGMDHRIAHDRHRPRSSKRTETIPLRFARPTRRASTMLTLAREHLGSSLPGAVLGVTVEARAVEIDHGAQLDLFTSFARRVEEVGELVGRLQAALGENAIFSPALVDTHRPEAAWKTLPFDIEAALAEAPVEKPRRSAGPTHVAPLADQAGRGTALPAVDAKLVVTTTPEVIDESARDAGERPRWPKAIARKPEDEPPPPLPPRPLELLEAPERVTLVKTSDTAERGVIVWRGKKHPLVSLGATERLEAEWWTDKPLARDYWVAEVADGRRLWLFSEPTGGVFVHGIFD